MLPNWCAVHQDFLCTDVYWFSILCYDNWSLKGQFLLQPHSSLYSSSTSWIMRIPPLTERSLADVFAIISQVVILRCCSSDGKLLKNTRDGWLTGFIFSFSQQLGLIWYCSQSLEQISLVKNQYLAFFMLLILLPSLPLPQPPQLLPPLSRRPISDSEDEAAA